MNDDTHLRIPRLRPMVGAGETLNDGLQRRLAAARQTMLEQYIAGRGIHAPEIIDAMTRVPREYFVPEVAREKAYEDHPIAIGYGQTLSQPYITALMLEKLAPRKGERILEIGGGSGYLTALLMELGAYVYTVEIIPEMAEALGVRLTKLGYRKFEVSSHDGHMGWLEFAPFDAVISAAAMREVPQALMNQVAMSGRIITPVGPADGDQTLVRMTLEPGGWKTEEICGVQFVPCVEG